MSEPQKQVAPGDPVTLILPEHIVQVEVEVARRGGFSVTLSSRGARTYESSWRLDEEGISWMRGYHAADSQAIAACRAAQGLSSQNEKSVDPDERAKLQQLDKLMSQGSINPDMFSKLVIGMIKK